jgi:hypothetical protein
MKALRIIGGLAIAHLIVSHVFFFHAFGRTMARFDSGEMPGALDRFSDIAADVLWFPFMQVAEALHVKGPGSVELVFVFANSLLWGIFLTFAFHGCRRIWRLRLRDVSSIKS